MVSKLQLFLLCSFIYQLLDPHKKIHVGDEFLKLSFFNIQMQNKITYVSPFF
jgi:hypothetical protein